jgi:hypothetical protein
VLTNLPVRVRSAPGDLREFSIDTRTANVTVSGRPEDISTLRERDVQVIVDVTDIDTVPGRLRLRVAVLTPPGVAPLNADPDTLNVVVSPKRVQQQ